MKNTFDLTPTSYVSVSGESKDIAISNLVSMSHMQVATQCIEEFVFKDDDYLPELLEIAEWMVIIKTYTDLNVDEMSDDDLVAEIYNKANNSLTLTLCNAINTRQLDAIFEAAEKRIQRRATESQFDVLCKDARAMLAKYDTVLEKVLTEKNAKNILKKINAALTADNLVSFMDHFKGATER